MDKELKEALERALETEYAWVDSWNDAQYDCRLSDNFTTNMEKIFKTANRQYVSLGHFRVTKMAAVAMLIAMLMALAGCGYIVRQAVIHWNETINTENGTIDVDFKIEDPDNTLRDSGFVKPELPNGYSIAAEEKDGSCYYVKYVNNEHYIVYRQEKGIESMELSIDSENNSLKEIVISGSKGYSSSKHGVQSITWSDGLYLYDICGDCKLEQLERMAKELSGLQ